MRTPPKTLFALLTLAFLTPPACSANLDKPQQSLIPANDRTTTPPKTPSEKTNKPSPKNQNLHAWPQWRGPNRDGFDATKTWPNTLTTKNLKQQWTKPLGPGYSGPIITKSKIFTVETKDKSDEIVRAFDRQSGKQLWQYSWKGAMSVPFFAARNGSWVRATPAYHNNTLYVAGMRDVLVAINTNNGKEIWRIDFPKQLKTPLPSFGFVCSPLIYKDHVYVQAGAAFHKVNAKSGKIIWTALKDGGGMWSSAFSSPAVASINNKTQILVQTRSHLAAVDPDSGKVLWKNPIKAFRGMNILTPIAHKNGVFTSAYGGKTLKLDIKSKDNTLTAETAWQNKLQGYMSTPIIIKDHAYLHLRNQRFACVDLNTGQIKWVTEQRFGKYWSMAAQGNKILALDQRGILYLLNATPEKFDLITSLQVTETDTWAHIAVTDRQIFIRNLKGISVYKWSDQNLSE